MSVKTDVGWIVITVPTVTFLPPVSVQPVVASRPVVECDSFMFLRRLRYPQDTNRPRYSDSGHTTVHRMPRARWAVSLTHRVKDLCRSLPVLRGTAPCPQPSLTVLPRARFPGLRTLAPRRCPGCPGTGAHTTPLAWLRSSGQVPPETLDHSVLSCLLSTHGLRLFFHNPCITTKTVPGRPQLQ